MEQGDPEVECCICFLEYEVDDVVAKLDCSERHVFHKECLSQWIRIGN